MAVCFKSAAKQTRPQVQGLYSIFKVVKIGSSILISRSAPTDQAIKVAKSYNLTLVGFVRGARMNIYSAKERVKSE